MISCLNSAMPTLIERLEEVMRAMRWSRADLQRVSGQSSSVVSQWLGKGSKEITSIGSLEAAIAIERASGFSSLWVAKGLGSKWAPMPALPPHTAEPKARYLTDDDTLQAMAAVLSRVPIEFRAAFGDLLRGWAIDGGEPGRIPALLAVLNTQPKLPARA